jgi:hypothetical protein
MAQATHLWSGSGYFKGSFEVARRDDGVYFQRKPEFYGSSRKPGKWTPRTIDKEPDAFAGTLTIDYITLKSADASKVRLPNELIEQQPYNED